MNTLVSGGAKWHLSRSVPITFILAIAMQTVALIWFVSALSSSVENNKLNISKLETKIASVETMVNTQAVTLGRMDENIKAIREIAERSFNGNTR